MSAARLYTPEVLGLAVDLARWPMREDLPLAGDARSATCGSTLAMQLGLDDAGRIDALGMQVRACAIGQAAAAIFARSAAGHDAQSLGMALEEMERWVADGGDLPAWPGLATIAAAREYPGRHGAILLPWKAAMAALSSASVAR